MKNFTLRCPCAFGLESVLSGEVKRLGYDDIAVSDGRVDFSSDAAGVARANLWLRTAERVQIILGAYHAESFEELFDGMERLPLELFVGRTDAFPVKGWSLESKLHSVPDCQSILKKAAVKRLSSRYHIEWFEESGPTVQIQFSIYKDEVTILLDTSGPGLHKRGYRRNANAAPIKETLAAGILDLARIYPDTRLRDPMCGSGTFLIEAALKARNIAPGIRRVFAAQKWHSLPADIWTRGRQEAMDLIRRDVLFHACGSDIDAESLEIAAQNAQNAGVEKLITLEKADVRDFRAPEEKTLVVANPPYGERLGSVEEAEELTRTMGRAFVPAAGVAYYIISSLEDFETQFGRRADKRRKLYNGMMKCQLYCYLAK